MNNPQLSQEMMINILKNGTYYYPATKHYGINSTNVICDRCKRTNLDVCIGLDTYDLCLSCIQDISKLHSQIIVEPSPVFHGPIMTMMIQEQFKLDPAWFKTKSYMMQGSCRKN
ncbi:hypothetical protein Klosneuvirus_1_117 [Klosneuvirus KNV1]|uniref:Uncharacterized protein n=1 Tax=Klosneuvirus KNV1 TaxID=1977640 RepID=A0A1V0SHQ8_9VIRU|nr:hypothetical protein Klosneuvirus_1_117 [Klosneuvirus KNV1]